MRFMNKLREPVNGLMHAVAAVAALVGLIILIVVAENDWIKLSSLIIYGTSLVLLLSASSAYHLVKGSPKAILWLRKLDHSAIYLLIAGTYTPICVNLFSGFWQWGMLALIWSLALVGIVTKLFIINLPRWFTATVYLIMGWLSVLAIQEILTNLPTGALVLLLLGGLAFTLGAVIYITKILDFVPGVFGFHEVWHIFVTLGCAFHYTMILIYVAASPV
jgi:hemolysin III